MESAKYEVYEELLRLTGHRTADVCRATGLNSSMFSHWKNGAYTPKNDKLKVIADFFEVSPWVFWADVDEVHTYIRQNEVAAGPGRVNDSYNFDYTDSTLMVCEPNDFHYTAGHGVSLAKIVGDSMYPVLQDGDTVLIEPTTEVSPSDFAIVKINGDESTCKHVEITSEGVWLRAENKEVFEDKFYSVQEVMTLPVTIIGKAVEIRRKL